MLILVEGARESGKSYLVNNAVETIPNLFYYKFDFPYWLNQLQLNELSNFSENTATHFISITNPITLFELNYQSFSDINIIMDRSIFSAYVWSKLLGRQHSNVLDQELKSIINSNYYQNIKLIYVYKDSRIENEDNRDKDDIFERYKNIEQEDSLFRTIISNNIQKLNDKNYHNNCQFLINDYTESSIDKFNDLIQNLIDK